MSWFPTPHVDAGEVVNPGSKRFIPFEGYAQPTLLDIVKDSIPSVKQNASTLSDAFIFTKDDAEETLPNPTPVDNPVA